MNFLKKLNWDKNDIKLIPSLNYKRGLKIKKQLRKKIFFPYKINNKRKIILSIKNLNHKLGNDILKKFIVAMHPSPNSKTEQVKLKESILKILRKTKNKIILLIFQKIQFSLGAFDYNFLSTRKQLKCFACEFGSI